MEEECGDEVRGSREGGCGFSGGKRSVEMKAEEEVGVRWRMRGRGGVKGGKRS